MKRIFTLCSERSELEKFCVEDPSLLEAQKCSDHTSSDQAHLHRITQAVWGGTGAKAEQLEGQILLKDFKSVFHGVIPRTQQRIRGQKNNPDCKERFAYDVLFSAPKSVSMALHLDKRFEVFDAHLAVVKEILGVIEQDFIAIRVATQHVRSVVKSGYLIAALIPSHITRHGDMKLDMHLVIMNGTKGPDGQWRSVYVETLLSERWIGSYYRQRLSEELQKLGYSLYLTQHGFEIDGYCREDLQIFSKSHRALIHSGRVEGDDPGEALLERKMNRRISPEQEILDYQARWREEAQLAGVGKVDKTHPILIHSDLATAIAKVNSAIEFLSDCSVSFTRNDIYAWVFSEVHLKGLSLEHVNRAIEENTKLIASKDERLTTPAALERETEMIARWMNGQGKACPLNAPILKNTSLSDAQGEMVLKTLTSENCHQIWYGLAGKGKTMLLKELITHLENSGITVRGVTPSVRVAERLQADLGLQANSFETLTLSPSTEGNKELWLIDDGELFSTKDFTELQRKADAIGANLLLIANRGQNAEVHFGSYLRSLINHGATTHCLVKIVRQQKSIPKRILELIVSNQGAEALLLLRENDCVTEIADPNERIQTIAAQYISLPSGEREKTLICVEDDVERLAITEAIRSKLKEEGSLGESLQVVQVTSRQLTPAQSCQIEHFNEGNYILLRRNYQGTALQRNQFYKVERRDHDELVVRSSGGRIYRINPASYKSKDVYASQTMNIAVGDYLRWTVSNPKAGQMLNQKFRVMNIQGTMLTIRNDQGHEQTIDGSLPLGIDYELPSAFSKLPRPTHHRVIVAATSRDRNPPYPFQARTIHPLKDIQIYTDNVECLYQWISRN